MDWQYSLPGQTSERTPSRASSREVEQPAKQPQSRKTAGVLQEETQSSESKQLEDKESASQERRQWWK
jgi:hypothetical protein